MQKEIKKLINSIDVKQDKDDAESKANVIIKHGVDAIDILVKIGSSVNKQSMDATKKKKILRAIIFTLQIFVKKNDTPSFKNIIRSKSKSLLVKLSSHGYESARQVLYKLGYYDSDIQKEQLLSLPIVENHLHDKEISFNEALLEINIGKTYSGVKGLQKDHYIIGYDGKRYHQLYRIGKNLLALRSSKKLKI